MQYFDAHSDIWTHVTIRHGCGETDVLKAHHLPMLRDGGAEGAMFVIWIDPPYTEGRYKERTKMIMAAARREIDAGGDFRVVRNCAEMEAARQEELFYIWIGLEGMARIGANVSLIDEYYDFGARHGMLTWNEKNALASGAMSGSDEGLTRWGRAAVRRMQRKKMLVDVSHLNEAGFWDIVRMTEAPFITSHSNCRALCDVPRNLTDEQLRAIRDLGGVAGLNAYGGFVDADPKKITMERFAEHAFHMIDVMGIDHVGFGFDFGDYLSPATTASYMSQASYYIPGLETCRKVPAFIELLRKRGLSEKELQKIARDNFLRVLRETVG